MSAAAAHADDWSKTFTITGKPELQVETSDANINVDTWDQKTIEARVTTEHYKIGEDGINILRSSERRLGRARSPLSASPFVNFGFNHHRGGHRDPYAARRQVHLHTGDGNIRLSSLKGESNWRPVTARQELTQLTARCTPGPATATSMSMGGSMPWASAPATAVLRHARCPVRWSLTLGLSTPAMAVSAATAEDSRRRRRPEYRRWLYHAGSSGHRGRQNGARKIFKAN